MAECSRWRWGPELPLRPRPPGRVSPVAVRRRDRGKSRTGVQERSAAVLRDWAIPAVSVSGAGAVGQLRKAVDLDREVVTMVVTNPGVACKSWILNGNVFRWFKHVL